MLGYSKAANTKPLPGILNRFVVWFDGTNVYCLVALHGDQHKCTEYDGGLLPDIILLTQGYYPRETRLSFSGVRIYLFAVHGLSERTTVQTSSIL